MNGFEEEEDLECLSSNNNDEEENILHSNPDYDEDDN